MKRGKSRFIAMTRNKSVFRFKLGKFTFVILKRVPTKALENIKFGSTVGNLYGVRFMSTGEIKKARIK